MILNHEEDPVQSLPEFQGDFDFQVFYNVVDFTVCITEQIYKIQPSGG